MGRIRNLTTMAELSAAFMKLFNWYNDRFFENTLSKVVITFESGYKKGAFGWIYTRPTWKQGDKERYCINISSDCFDRPLIAIAGTLLHEMCHLYAIENNIKDTSRAGIYHNKKFREICLSHGLDCFEDDKIGFGITSVKDEFRFEILAAWEVKEIRLQQIREEKEEKQGEKKSSTIKLQCPCCGAKARITSPDVRLMCADCTEISLDSGDSPVYMVEV